MMANPTHYLIDPLTNREFDVLSAMAEGMSNQEIANHLQLALATVKWYAGQIYSKLDVSNRQEAVERARQLGVFNSESIATTTTPHNLPQMTTPFVGRTRELAELHDRLNQDDTRLITIMAQGGMGKTRLALALAEHNLGRFNDGIYLVQLAPITDDSDAITSVATAIANVLGLQHYDDSVAMQDNLVRYLHIQNMLLILDNFEHLLTAGTLVSEILSSAPDVKILVTSRERLRLRGEVVYSLQGMTSTDDNHNDAMTLFLQSTQRLRPDYITNDEDNQHITEICRIVEGLPLGIELASGWMDTLSPETIVSELQKSLDILETDLLDVPERHRSIHATFAYTWDRLTVSERETMMTLSLFKGGITQETAHAVAMADIRRLRLLVNKSLLHHHSQIDRYTIHELLRQFCFDKLLASGNYENVVTVYMSYFADYAQQRYDLMDDFDGDAFQAIRADWDNIAFAWWKMFEYRRYDLLEKTYKSIWFFSSMQGHSYECVALFEPVIEHLENLPERDETLELFLAHLTMKLGDLLTGIDSQQRAFQTVDRGIKRVEALGKQTPQLIEAHNLRLFSSYDLLSFERIYQLAQDLITLAQDMELPYCIVNVYTYLWEFEEFVGDKTVYQESLKVSQEIWEQYYQSQDNRTTVLRYGSFVRLLSRIGADEEAIQLVKEELQLYEQAHWLYGISKARGQLMVFAHRASDLKSYGEHVIAILEWHKHYGRDWQLIGCISGINGQALYYVEEYLLSATFCLFVKEHPISVDLQKDEAKKIMEKVRPRLSDEEYQSALNRAKPLTLQQAYTLAIEFWSDYVASQASLD